MHLLRGIHAGRSKCTCRRGRADTFCPGVTGTLFFTRGGAKVAVSAQDVANDALRLTTAEVANLIFEPVENDNGDGYASFAFKLVDAGSDNNVGDGFTMTVNVRAVNDPATLSATSSTKGTQATDAKEVLATFEITDVDNDFEADAGLITRSGADAARFTHSVTRKAGAGNDDTYIVTVGWAAGQMPAFDTTQPIDNRYEVTFDITGAEQNYDLTVNINDNSPTFLNPPAALNVDETAGARTLIANGDFNAHAAGISNAQDSGASIRYSLKGGPGGDFMSQGEVEQYLQIDADTGVVSEKATLPDQDDSNVDAKLRAAVKFIVVATDTRDTNRTTEHTVTLTINNVLDVTPTFNTAALGNMVATAGATAFDGGNTYSLSGQTTESGATPQNRVIQFREDPSNSNSNVDIAPNGDITLTGNIAQGVLNFDWQWKYAGQAGWTDGGSLSITVNAPAAPALVLDGNSAGAGNTTSEDLRGDNTANTFIIDDDQSPQASADTIAGFEAQDSIRLGDDDGTGTATVTFEYDGTDTLLYNTDTTGDDADAKAGKVLAVLTGYDLSADGNALQASDVVGAGTVINVHGGGTDAGRQTMQGAATTKDVFSVDGTAGDRASADIIKAFEDGTDIVKVAGDINIFWHVEDGAGGVKNTILRSTNSDSEDNIIAIIEGFDADAAGVTFDDSDFVGNGTIQEIT